MKKRLDIFFRGDRTAAKVFQQREGLDGIADLADYALSLRPAQQALLQAQAEERRTFQLQLAALDALPDPVTVLSWQGVILFVNEAWKSSTPQSFFQAAACDDGQNFLEVCECAPANWKESARLAAMGVRQAMAGGEQPCVLECQHVATQRWFQLAIRPLRVAGCEGVLVVQTDVTAQKLLVEAREFRAEQERDRAETTARLRAAVEELEAFSYSVSHDLRAPLRAIHGFSRILMEDHAGQLPPKAQHYLELVRQNTEEMQRLIESLLSFSRLHRQPVEKQWVEPAQLVRQCLETLLDPSERRQIDVRVGELPPCQADPTLLKQVWANLLCNALKFTSQKDAARIEVGCERRAGEDVYFVRDNGVGFDMKYADKLFRVFQRLHRAEDFAGTGIGLALIQRIVQRHGGRVWGEAEAGRGATFFFTLSPAT